MNGDMRLVEQLRQYDKHNNRGQYAVLVHKAAATIEQQAQRIGAWSELLWDIYKAVYGDKDARGMADPLAILPKVVLALRKRNDVLEVDNAGSEAGIERLTQLVSSQAVSAMADANTIAYLRNANSTFASASICCCEFSTCERDCVPSLRAKLSAAEAKCVDLRKWLDIFNSGGFADADALAARFITLTDALAAAEVERDAARDIVRDFMGDFDVLDVSDESYIEIERRAVALWDIKKRAEAAEQRATVIRNMVDEQALDAGLWFVAKTAPEAYLQQALRRLHAAVEGGAIAARTEEKT